MINYHILRHHKKLFLLKFSIALFFTCVSERTVLLKLLMQLETIIRDVGEALSLTELVIG